MKPETALVSRRRAKHAGRALARRVHIVLGGLCASLFTASVALADATLPGASAESLLALARQDNPAFVAEGFETQAARERAGAAGALPDPRFELELMDVTNTMSGGGPSVLPGEVGETRYRIVQPLPGWGKRALEVESAQARAGQADAARDAAWLALASAVRTTWLRYYQAEREAEFNREQHVLLHALEETALARYRSGLGSQQAVLQAQREASAQRLAALAIEQRRQAAVAALNALLGRAPQTPLAAPLDPAPLPADLALAALIERARTAHPEVRAQAIGVDAARIERERARRERQPDYAIGVTYNRPRDGRESWDLMFEMMIPLQQGVRDARERETAALGLAADARRRAAESRIAGELGAAWSMWRAANDSLHLLRATLLPQAQAGRDAARAALAANQAEFDAVLMAERQVLDTRLALLQAEIDARLALVEIQRLSGETE
jgi:outer membrane protein TolC